MIKMELKLKGDKEQPPEILEIEKLEIRTYGMAILVKGDPFSRIVLWQDVEKATTDIEPSEEMQKASKDWRFRNSDARENTRGVNGVF